MENESKPAGEAHLLAPWYVSGTLDPQDAAWLAELSSSDPELMDLIDEARQEAAEVSAANLSLGEPSQAVWARIEQSIENESRMSWARQLRASVNSLSNAVSDFFGSFTLAQWQAATAFAVALFFIQAGAIVYILGSEPPAKFHTASGAPSHAAAPAAFIVSFNEGASIGDIGSLLDDAGAVIVDGPNADMLYNVALREHGADTKANAYAKLRASKLVKLILPAK